MNVMFRGNGLGREAATARCLSVGRNFRKRWGNMPTARSMSRLKTESDSGARIYPFGPTTPYWRLDVHRGPRTGGEKVPAVSRIFTVNRGHVTESVLAISIGVPRRPTG
jgi:hypothetical protein